MEEKELSQLLKKLEGNTLYKIVFFCVTMLLMVGIYMGLLTHIKGSVFVRTIREADVNEDYEVLSSLSARKDGEKIILSGWAMKLNSVTVGISLLVKNTEKNDSIVLTSNLSERKDVEEYFDPNCDYGTIGYDAELDMERVDKDSCYEIYVYLTYEKKQENENGVVEFDKVSKKVFSGMYLYNGELFRYNPLTFKEPDITDFELKRVIENGTLRSYNSETEVWIYQYEKQIYLITKQEYESMNEREIDVPIMPRTSRVELLPEHRVQYGFDHIGSYSASDEYKREGVLPYLVVVADLPSKYPITYISMGLYDGESNTWIDSHIVEMEDWSFENRKSD